MRVAWIAILACRLPHFFLEADMVEEAGEDVERPIEPLQLGQSGDTIIGIKVLRQIPYRQAKSLHAHLGWLHHHHPVAYDRIHNHVEECDGQGVALSHSVVLLEWY